MIDTAAADAVVAAGVRSVAAGATHGLFGGPAYERLAAAPFERVLATDTVPLPTGASKVVEVCSCTPRCSPIRSDGSSPATR